MKKYIIIFICLSCIFMLSCGSPSDADTNANANANAEAHPPADNAAADSVEEAASEVPQNQDIFGAISEIVGNLTTINLAVMPETGIPVPMTRRPFDPDNLPEGVEIGEDGRISFDPDNMPEGFQIINEDGGMSANGGNRIQAGVPAAAGSGAPQRFDPDNMPEGVMMFDGEGGPQRIVGDGSGRPVSRMGSMMLDYTGEEKEFIIPVGLPIYALTHDEDGNEVETEIELADIESGNVISVIYKEDGKTIDKILVSQITAMKPSEVEEMRERINNMMNDDENEESEDGGQ